MLLFIIISFSWLFLIDSWYTNRMPWMPWKCFYAWTAPAPTWSLWQKKEGTCPPFFVYCHDTKVCDKTHAIFWQGLRNTVYVHIFRKTRWPHLLNDLTIHIILILQSVSTNTYTCMFFFIRDQTKAIKGVWKTSYIGRKERWNAMVQFTKGVCGSFDKQKNMLLKFLSLQIPTSSQSKTCHQISHL